MPRWEPDAVGRLQAAAFDLFAEQGFEATTVAEITERAGLTRRSFFNHFTDKREVLFGPVARQQREIVTREIEGCDASVAALPAVLRALGAVADELFEHRRDDVVRRRRIVDATPELAEREAAKRADLTDAVAAALRGRGVDELDALLTARVGVLVHQTAMHTWTRDTDARPLREHLADALPRVRRAVGAPR